MRCEVTKILKNSRARMRSWTSWDLGSHICLSFLRVRNTGILKLAPISYLDLARFKTVEGHFKMHWILEFQLKWWWSRVCDFKTLFRAILETFRSEYEISSARALFPASSLLRGRTFAWNLVLSTTLLKKVRALEISYSDLKVFLNAYKCWRTYKKRDARWRV